MVGSMNLDHVARVERLPSAGATVPATDYRTAAGGKGLNQAVSAARQGATTVMVSAVGSDGPGEELLGVLDAEGIDRSRVRVAPDAPTGVALIAVAAGGENMLVVAAGANGTVAPDQLDGFDWRPGDVLVCQLEVPLATVEAAMRAAREGGARTLLNPAPAGGPLAPSLLALVDVLVPNEGEALALAAGGAAAAAQAAAAAAQAAAAGSGGAGAGGAGAGGSDAGGAGAEGAGAAGTGAAGIGVAGEGGSDAVAAAGRALAAESGGVVIVTLGEQGSLWCSASAEPARIPAHPVHAVDTTAAGDAYCGALAAALAGGADLATGLARASVAGSLATTRHGAVPSIPTAEQVDAALERSGGVERR